MSVGEKGVKGRDGREKEESDSGKNLRKAPIEISLLEILISFDT